MPKKPKKQNKKITKPSKKSSKSGSKIGSNRKKSGDSVLTSKIQKSQRNKKNKRSKNQGKTLVCEVISVKKGHGFVRELFDEAVNVSTAPKSNREPREIFIGGRLLLGAVPGDKVLVKISPDSAAKGADKNAAKGAGKGAAKGKANCLPEGEILEILESYSFRDEHSIMTGTIVEYEDKLCLVADSFGHRHPLYIAEVLETVPPIKAFDKVSFRLKTRGDKHHLHTVVITGAYGFSGNAETCVNAYLEEKRIVENCDDISAFPEEVLDNAKLCGENIDGVSSEELCSRLDLRELPIFTIDGADTKDIDDAIFIEKTKDGFKLIVSIADVSYYVTPESPLDREAVKRGNSVYIADKVVPMLPGALSNGICSLNPNVDRLCFSCIMDISNSGELKSFDFKKGIIRSRVQGVYDEVNEIIDFIEKGDNKEADLKSSVHYDKYREVIHQIPIMKKLSDILKKNRDNRNALNLFSPESKIICEKLYGEANENSKCVDVVSRTVGKAEGIIEEFMLCANNAAARLGMEKQLPFIYRIHEEPSEEKLLKLKSTLEGLSIPVPEIKPTNECLSKILKKAISEGKSVSENADTDTNTGNARRDIASVVNGAMLRTMMKAKYSSEPLGHFGLSMAEYAHFTSPIRRYPDLFIHRVLSKYVYSSGNIGAKTLSKLKGNAHDFALSSTSTELRAVNAERACNKFYFAEYMAERKGEEFWGTVSGVTDISIYVMLDNTVEGRVALCYGFEGDSVSTKNPITGESFTLGDRVRVRCVDTSVPLGNVDFEVVG